MTEAIILNNGTLEARINPNKAELFSLRNIEHDIEFIAEYAPGKTAPILAPTPGPVYNNKIRVEGKEYPMPQHGFARDIDWKILSGKTDTEAHLAFDYIGRTEIKTSKGSAMLPFDLRIGASFKFHEVYESRLEVSLYIDNLDGKKEVYSGLAWHPTFAKSPSSEIEFFPKSTRSEMVGDSLICGAERVILKQDGYELSVSSNIRAKVLWPWASEDKNYICIEPWSGKPDVEEIVKELKDRTGIITAQPGEIKGLNSSVTAKITS